MPPLVARRAVLIPLPLEDFQRLDILATRRGVRPEQLAEDVILDWLAGPGHRELVDALLRRPRRSPPRGRQQSPGQLTLVEGA